MFSAGRAVVAAEVSFILLIMVLGMAQVESFQNHASIIRSNSHFFRSCHVLWLQETAGNRRNHNSYCLPKALSATATDGDEDDLTTIIKEEDDENARSQFGTRQYWDDLYLGRGDFPAEEYSWYFGWDILQSYVKEYLSLPGDNADQNVILCPGIGNEPLLVDLFKAGYTRLTAFDYSEHAIERQKDTISYSLPAKAMNTIELHTLDARKLPLDWTDGFDAIIEKGALDAIYLSGDGNVERAVEELQRVLKPGGKIISVSGVVPEVLRREIFRDWEWIRDGSDELKAGCFVLRNTPGVNL